MLLLSQIMPVALDFLGKVVYDELLRLKDVLFLKLQFTPHT